MLRDVGRRIAKTWEGEEGLVRSCYRSRIVKSIFTMFTLGAEKREIFRPGRLNFRPLHNTTVRSLSSDQFRYTGKFPQLPSVGAFLGVPISECGVAAFRITKRTLTASRFSSCSDVAGRISLSFGHHTSVPRVTFALCDSSAIGNGILSVRSVLTCPNLRIEQYWCDVN